MADGDIKLSVSLDTAQSKKSAQDLGSVIQRALSSSSPKVQSLGLQLQKVNDKAKKVADEMNRLENTKIPTAQFQALTKEIESTLSQITKVETELKKLQSTGKAYVPTEEYSRLLSDESWLSKRINSLSEKKTLTSDQQAELRELKQELADVRGEIQAVKDVGEAYKKSDVFIQKENEVKALQDRLQTLNEESQKLQDSGQAYTSGANTERYQNLAQTQSYLSTQADILTQKIQSAMDSVKGLRSVFISTISSVSTGLKSISSAMGNVISSIKRATSAVLSHKNTANTSFKRILTTIIKYVFGVRSIYYLYRKLRQTIKEGFTELGKSFPEINSEITSLKSSFNAFKSSLVSAFQPIISYVIPILTSFIDSISTAMNGVANFAAMLTGQSYYYKAVKNNKDAADAISNTGDAAEEATDKLGDYDNLLVVDKDTSSSSSSSSSGYSWEKVDVTSSGLFDTLKQAWEEGDWKGLGTTISGKLQEMMDNIPWNTIQEKASNFGTNLANFLNGLFSTDKNGENVFTSTGETIAEALNTAFDFLNSFGNTFDWSGFGSSLGSGITTFFETFEWDEAGEACNTWIIGILDAGIALLTTTDWEEIGTSLGEFLEEFDFNEILSKVTTLCSNLITAIGKVITGFEKNTTEKTKLETAIGGLLGVLVISKNIPLTLSFAVALGGLWLGKKFYEIQSGNTVDQSFVEEVGDILEGLFGENKVKINIFEIISFVWDELTGQNDGEASQFEKDFKQWISLGIGVITGWTFPVVMAKLITGDWSTEGKDWENFKKGIVDGMKNALTTIFINSTPFCIPVNLFKLLDFVTEGTKLGDAINDLKSKFEEKWKKIWEGETYSETGANGMPSDVASQVVKTKGLKDLGKDMLEGIIQGFKDDFSAWTQPIKDMLDQIIKDIKEIFGIESPAKEMKPYGQYIFEGIIEGFKNAYTELKKEIQQLPEKIKGWIQEFFGTGYNILDGIGTAVSVGVSLVQEGWSTVSSWVGETAQKGTEAVTKGIGIIQDGWSTVSSWVGNTTQKGADLVEQAVGLIKSSAWTEKGGTVSTWVEKAGQLGSVVAQTVGLIKSKVWEDKGGTIFSWATKEGKLGTVIAQAIGLEKSETWKNAGGTVASWVNNISNKKMDVKSKVSLAKGSNWSKLGSVASWVNRYNNIAIDAYVDLKRGNFKTVQSWLSKTFSTGTDSGKTTVSFGNKTASGGIITSAGVKLFGAAMQIPAYAKGTLNALSHGTMFVAGEAGPEVVGHIGGRTEVLNQSQIANAIYSAVVAGMSSILNKMSAFGIAMDFTPLIQSLAQTPIPVIVTGHVLPTTEEFRVSHQETRQDLGEIKGMIQQLINVVTAPEDRPKEPIIFAVDGKVIAQLVWDETAKKYKQTGNPQYRFS